MLEHTIVQFHEQMKRDTAQLVEARKRTRSEAPKLKADLRKLEIEARNLSGAIAQYGTHRSPTLLTQLSHVENRIDTITRELEEPASVIPDVPIEHIREIVLQKAKDLEDILLGSPEDAKLALHTHVRPLVLTPIEAPEGRLLRVSGTVDLFSGASPVMPLVAPQGFEPFEMEQVMTNLVEDAHMDAHTSKKYLMLDFSCPPSHFLGPFRTACRLAKQTDLSCIKRHTR
jgi:hypothetical protein